MCPGTALVFSGPFGWWSWLGGRLALVGLHCHPWCPHTSWDVRARPGVPKASAGRGQLGPTPSLDPLDKQGKTALASTRLSTFALMENALKILKTICFLRSVVLRSFQDVMMYFAGWKEHH